MECTPGREIIASRAAATRQGADAVPTIIKKPLLSYRSAVDKVEPALDTCQALVEPGHGLVLAQRLAIALQ